MKTLFCELPIGARFKIGNGKLMYEKVEGVEAPFKSKKSRQVLFFNAVCIDRNGDKRIVSPHQLVEYSFSDMLHDFATEVENRCSGKSLDEARELVQSYLYSKGIATDNQMYGMCMSRLFHSMMVSIP